MGRLSFLAAICVASVAVAGGAASSGDGKTAPAFSPGEQSVYRVHYLGINAGLARIQVTSATTHWGREVWPIVTDAKSDRKLFFYPIKDRFISYWDFEQQQTIGSDFYVDENKTRRFEQVQLDHRTGSAKVFRRKEGEQGGHRTYEVAPGSGDVAAAAFALRNKPLAPGRTFEIPVFTGAKSFVLHANVLGRERMQTAFGERDVYKVRVRTDFSGKMKSKRDLYAYFTTDPAHVPVRIEAEFVVGAMVAELVHYQPGQRASTQASAAAQR